jgi:hypothetical protein
MGNNHASPETVSERKCQERHVLDVRRQLDGAAANRRSMVCVIILSFMAYGARRNYAMCSSKSLACAQVKVWNILLRNTILYSSYWVWYRGIML